MLVDFVLSWAIATEINRGVAWDCILNLRAFRLGFPAGIIGLLLVGGLIYRQRGDITRGVREEKR